MIVAIDHRNYPLFTFLRSLFIVHDWYRPGGTDVRSCRVCGRREELDVDDGVNLAAWHPVWEGYAGAHFARRQARGAAADARLPGNGNGGDLSDQNGAAAPTGAGILARLRRAGE
jgi:hypothetical protein